MVGVHCATANQRLTSQLQFAELHAPAAVASRSYVLSATGGQHFSAPPVSRVVGKVAAIVSSVESL